MNGRPVIFGEVLFDCFPDGASVLGGAPFNVAWHLCAFGLDPLMVSRVGDDEGGREVLQKMERWGMDTNGVQTDPTHPTGRVTVHFEQKDPSFAIEPSQAYDFIDAAAAIRVVEKSKPGLIYHGTLALRQQASWTALERMVEPGQIPIFFDVNLRPPWWSVDRVRWGLNHGDWIKMNRSELLTLVPRLRTSETGFADAIRDLSVGDGANVVVTSGNRPVEARIGGSFCRRPVSSVDHIVDTVGAGDAFSAVLILGILRNWSSSALLERAARFAGDLCAVRGATLPDRNLYEERLEEWESL